MFKILILLAVSFITVFSQNASDYFPSETGMKWYFKNVPFDSLNRPIDSLTSYQIDSFALVTDYEGRLSNIILSKYGTAQTILQSPWSDTNYIHTENAYVWNYINGIGDLIGGITFDLEGWYSVYRLNASTSTSYNLFMKDTLITIDSVNYTLRIEVNGRRVNDQVISTPYGDLSCKKIIITPTVKIIPPIIPIPITLFSMPDTIYIAPGYYKVRSVRPSASINLSLLGYPSFTIPGSRIDAIKPPPVLSIDSLFYNASGKGDTISFAVNNDGEDTINWTASIISGNEWMSLKDTSGTEADTLTIYIDRNDTTLKKFGMIELSAEGAFNSPQYITVIQEEGEVVVTINESIHSPEEYSLGQNYPNPFNPLTNISFNLKKNGNIKLLLYDMLGNNIAVIADGYYSAGRHDIKYNAEGISSGVYIYRLTSEEFSSSKKMVVLK